jgi:hypothetical protein
VDIKIETTAMKFNQEKAAIKQLKVDIDQLRRERVVFDSVFKKLEYDLMDKEKELFSAL